MKSPLSDLRHKAQRLYPDFLLSSVEGINFFPLNIKITKLSTKDHYLDLQKKIQEISRVEKQKNSGITLSYQDISTRRYGVQSIPAEVSFHSHKGFVTFIDKREESENYFQDMTLLKKDVPELLSWAQQKKSIPFIVKNHPHWKEFLSVCRYFLDNSVHSLYLRQIPLNIHTKFIEEHKAALRLLLDHCLPPERINSHESNFQKRFGINSDPLLVRCRFLDPKLMSESGQTFKDISVPIDQLKEWKNLERQNDMAFLIVENKMTFLTLPDLPRTIALFGKGITAEAFRHLPFLKKSPLYYWGDMDIQGLEILSQFRKSFPQVRSLFMNFDTLDQFKHWCVPGNHKTRGAKLCLTPEERELFKFLAENSLRLEQERIPQAFIDQGLKKISLE